MAEITQPDFIASEEIIKEIHRINDALLGVVKTGKEMGTAIKGADSIKTVRAETEKLTASQIELQKIEKQIATVQAKNNEEYLKQKNTLTNLNNQLKQKTALGDRDARTISATNASLKELNAALQKNRDAYKSLANEEARASKEGKELKAIIDAQDKAVKAQNESLGDFRDSVGHYEKGIKGLKQELIAARNEMANIAKTTGSQTSPEFLAAAEKAGELKDQINDLNDSLKNASASKFENLGNSLKDVGSKLLSLDFEGAMNSAKQFQSIAGSISFKDLSTAVGQFGQTMANVGKTLLTNPLFIMAAVIGGVIAAFKYFNDQQEKASKRQIEQYKRELDALTDRYDHEIRLQKIVGKNTFELEKAKQKAIIESADKSIKAIGRVTEVDLLSSLLLRRTNLKVNEEKNQQLIEYTNARRDAKQELEALELEQAEFERKTSADTTKQKQEDLFNLNKFRLNVSIAAQKDIIDNENASFAARLVAVGQFNKLKNDLAKLERDEALKEESLTAEGIKLINAQLYQSLIDNQKEASTERTKIENERLDSIEKRINAAGDKMAATFKKPVPVKLFESIETGITKATETATYKTNQFIDGLIKGLESVREIFGSFSNAFGNLLDSLTAKRLQNIDQEERRLDEQTAKRILAAGDNDAAVARIEADAELRRLKLEKKRIEAQRKAAIFDKSVALVQAGIQTALNIVKVFPNPVLMALAAAIGAIQIAAIATKPIPQYFVGTKSAEGGPAYVGEKGAELMRKPGQDWELTPSHATLMNVPRGTEIVPHAETMRRLAMGALSQNGGTMQVPAHDPALLSEMQSLNRNIQKIKPVRQSLVRSGATVYYAIKDSEGHTKLLGAINMGKGKWGA